MKPPTFFLSSTIYDFQDLRSAVKYYLEQQGCRVLASEHNDFPKPLDTHSYEACLKAIREAEFFILLIGARVGGWYDQEHRVSITQAEYREGYRLHQEGKMKLLNFVRGDIWRMKEDRKELAKHLETLGYDPGARSQILNYPSKAAIDAEFIAAFIQEIARNRETIEALKGKGPLPSGNWVHVFNNFRELIEPIQLQVFAGRPVEDAGMRRLLRSELLEFLRMSLIRKKQQRVFTPRWGIEQFHASLPGTLSLDQMKTLVNTKWFDNLCSLWLCTINSRYYPVILPRALASSTFLEFDAKTGKMEELPVYAGLLELSREIEIFQLGKNADMMKFFAETSPKFRGCVGDQMEVQTGSLLVMLHIIDRWSNIIDLCKAILQHLDGKAFLMPNLRPRNPILTDEHLNSQEATAEEAETFVHG